ncbi:hypothetical protein [Shewanella algae]|uniref:hypothetical protein n=1 Tax=Shewanella algae TaxID=38313 RepID=UPI003007057E
MSNESLKVSYRWIWLPISFGLALCVIVLSLYFIEFGKFGLSKDPTEWASFGSLLAGIFTFLSATGTIGTLIFMIRQHQQLTLSQAEISKKQMEILEFEKYEKHKLTFSESCEYIENHYDGRYHFPSKTRAYHQLFPNNSPKMTKYESSKEAILCSHIKNFNEIVISARTGKISITQLEALSRITDFIRVSPKRKGKRYISGDTHIKRTPPRFNIFNLKDCFFVCYDYFFEVSRLINLNVKINTPTLEEIDFVELSKLAYNEIKREPKTDLKIYLEKNIHMLFWLSEKLIEKDLTPIHQDFEDLLNYADIPFAFSHYEGEIELESEILEGVSEKLKNIKQLLIELNLFESDFSLEEQEKLKSI